MPRRAALVSSPSHAVPTRPSSPKSDAKRSSAGGQADASAEPATDAMRTRVSSTTASPRLASSATSSVGELRARSAPRTERGRWLAGAERMPRSSMSARVRHAVSDSRNASVVDGSLPATTSSACRSRSTAPSARAAGPRARGRRAAAPWRGSASPPPPARRALGHAGRHPEQREVERGVDVESGPRGRPRVRARTRASRARTAALSVAQRRERLQRTRRGRRPRRTRRRRSGCCQPPRRRSGSRACRAPGRRRGRATRRRRSRSRRRGPPAAFRASTRGGREPAAPVERPAAGGAAGRIGCTAAP